MWKANPPISFDLERFWNANSANETISYLMQLNSSCNIDCKSTVIFKRLGLQVEYKK